MAQKTVHNIILREQNQAIKTQVPSLFFKKYEYVCMSMCVCVCVFCVFVFRRNKEHRECWLLFFSFTPLCYPVFSSFL